MQGSLINPEHALNVDMVAMSQTPMQPATTANTDELCLLAAKAELCNREMLV